MTSVEASQSCPACASPTDASHSFCPNCGTKLSQRTAERTYRWKTRYKQRVLVSIGIIVFYILGQYLLFKTDLPLPPLSSDLFFFLLVAAASAYYSADLKGAWKGARKTLKGKTLLYLLTQVLFSFLVFYGMEALRSYFGAELLLDPLEKYRSYSRPILAAFLSLAVFPPLTEELGFRGLLFGQLSELTNPSVIILTTSFLFAWVHFRFLSLPWLFLEGIYLGWIRHREGTIWPCILCHSLHNGLALFWVMSS
ncbi:MAG: type II CAAX prenyl endopeptidase Rce1 family protein [Flavobacteriales bacterium]